jgi:hypothetical protein
MAAFLGYDYREGPNRLMGVVVPVFANAGINDVIKVPRFHALKLYLLVHFKSKMRISRAEKGAVLMRQGPGGRLRDTRSVVKQMLCDGQGCTTSFFAGA